MELQALNPQAQTVEEAVKAAARPADLAGKRIGLYWNLKAGGDHALSHAAELLARRFPETTFTRYWGEVGGLIRMATEEDIARIAAECDAVVGTSSD